MSQSTSNQQPPGGNDAYLDAAIEAHPELWATMRATFERGQQNERAGWVLTGMVSALCIVGGFPADLVMERLAS